MVMIGGIPNGQKHFYFLIIVNLNFYDLGMELYLFVKLYALRSRTSNCMVLINLFNFYSGVGERSLRTSLF